MDFRLEESEEAPLPPTPPTFLLASTNLKDTEVLKARAAAIYAPANAYFKVC